MNRIYEAVKSSDLFKPVPDQEAAVRKYDSVMRDLENKKRNIKDYIKSYLVTISEHEAKIAELRKTIKQKEEEIVDVDQMIAYEKDANARKRKGEKVEDLEDIEANNQKDRENSDKEISEKGVVAMDSEAMAQIKKDGAKYDKRRHTDRRSVTYSYPVSNGSCSVTLQKISPKSIEIDVSYNLTGIKRTQPWLTVKFPITTKERLSPLWPEDAVYPLVKTSGETSLAKFLINYPGSKLVSARSLDKLGIKDKGQ